jgi:hypothetical protein
MVVNTLPVRLQIARKGAWISVSMESELIAELSSEPLSISAWRDSGAFARKSKGSEWMHTQPYKEPQNGNPGSENELGCPPFLRGETRPGDRGKKRFLCCMPNGFSGISTTQNWQRAMKHRKKQSLIRHESPGQI